MRLCIFTATGFGCGIAAHMSKEGHSVTVSTEWTEGTAIPDISILDSPIFTRLADMLRGRGSRVLGPTSWGSLLVSDNGYKQNLISAIGYKPATDTTYGTHVIVSCWFNGNKFISKSIVFNYTKMMSGDVGTDVDSSGYLVYFNVDKSKLVREILEPLERFLRKAGHKGCFSVECIVATDKDVYVKDISADLAKPYTTAIYENSKMSKSDILLSIFNESSAEIRPLDPWVAGVMLSVYPYPQAKPEMIFPIDGLNPLNIKHSWLMDVENNGDGYQTGELSGNIGYITARGVSPQESCRRVYRTIENIRAKDLQYRNDVGKGVSEKFYQLQTLGWIL